MNKQKNTTERILITTQTIDKNDPILGFFHRWMEEFAKHFETINVICLKEGEHSLPPNVHVHSLGKEAGESRSKYLFKFFGYLFKLRGRYDTVFSHMNPHYIVLAGVIWKLSGKRIFFWRNHAKMNVMTWVAAQYAERVFYTSPHACTARFKHSVQMPVGIDTELFSEQEEVVRNEENILFLGRLSPVKRPELFLRAVKGLPSFKVHVYGETQFGQGEYKKQLVSLAGANVTFHGAVANTETPKIYSSCGIFVNLTPSGSMDKTIFEAAACGALLLVTNDALKGVIPEEMLLAEANEEAVQKSIQALYDLPEENKKKYRKDLRRIVVDQHSLKELAKRLTEYMRE